MAHSELGAFLAELGQSEEALLYLESALDIPAPLAWTEEVYQSALAQVRAKIDDVKGSSEAR